MSAAAGGALLIALAACAPSAQLLKPDAGPLPPALAAQLPSATTIDASQVHWRNYFKDPRLLALIEAALTHNRDLRVAAARVEEARAQWAMVRAERLPNLQFLGQGRLDRSYAPGIGTGPERRLDMALSAVGFELDFFGRLANLSAAARAQFLATEEARRATELALVAQVAELYHTQRQTEELLQRARSQVASRTQSLEILTRARDTGLVHELELEQAHVQLEAARAQRAQLGHLQNQTDGLMRLLVGRMPEQLVPGLPLYDLPSSHVPPLNLSADVLLLRPDVVAAEHRLSAAQANVLAARAAFFPRISLTASLGTASSGLADLFRAGAWVFQPTLSLPLFDGGRTQAGFDLAKAREMAVVAQYEHTVQQAFRDVADQLSARDSLAAQMRAADRMLAAQRARLAIHRQRHAAGMSGLLEVLDAEREMMAAEQNHVVLFRAQLDAAVGLYKALGGGAPPRAGATKPTALANGVISDGS